jgi:hypothetical protein
MLTNFNVSWNCLRYVCLFLLPAASACAKLAAPLVQCEQTTFDGVQVCAVTVMSYAHYAGNGVAPCPSGVTSTGSGLLCEQSFAAAIKDAKLFFAATSPPSEAYVIKIPSGAFDFSVQTAALLGSNGAIDVSGIAPVSAGCLSGNPATDGTVALSGNPCLVISGASTDHTTLVTAAGLTGIAGFGLSHVMIENMTMIQPNESTTQGIYVAEASRSINGVEYPTLTLDISAGFPTPLGLFNISCALNGAAGCSKAGLSTISNDIYMRAFTNSAAPQLIASTAELDSNAQVPWGFPSPDHSVKAAVSPTQPDPIDFPYRWTLTLSRPMSQRSIPSYYSGTTEGVMNMICMKVDHANAFRFDDNAAGGTDVIMSNMVWIGAARGTFRGIKGTLNGESLGAQVYNSSIERGAPVGGQVPCLSTQSGGMQFGQPGDKPIYGSAVYGLRAEGTGDDTVAMFNDIGGTQNRQGGFYPQTFVRQSFIGNSFARDVLLMTSVHKTHLSGNSPVIVDTFTQTEINNKGNCDPLILGTGNCPVTYTDN